MRNEIREKVQAKSKEIGRCICSLPTNPFTCPCKFFIDKDICHCAMEKHEGITQEEWANYNLNK